MFTRTCHCTIQWTKWTQSIHSHPIFLQDLFQSSSNLTRFPKSSFQVFWLKCCIHFSCLCPSCAPHLIPFDSVIIIIFCEQKFRISSLWNFLQSPTSSLLGQNNFLSTLFSNTMTLFSCICNKKCKKNKLYITRKNDLETMFTC
jgi:hypothetical protein